MKKLLTIFNMNIKNLYHTINKFHKSILGHCRYFSIINSYLNKSNEQQH